MRKSFLTFLALSFTLSIVGQSQYYLSTSGDDNNDGTSVNQAWKTLQYALDQLSSNSTLNILEGSYNEKVYLNVSGTATEPIVITNYNDDEVMIDGSNLTSDEAIIAIYDQSYIHIDGLIIANNSQLDAQGIIVEGNCQGIEIRNNEIYNINFSSNPLEIADSSKNAQPLVVYGTDADHTITSLKIENNVLRDSRTGYSEGLAVNGNVDGFSISNNRVYNISNIGIDIIGHEGEFVINDQARNGVINNNVVYNCKSPYATAAGIYVDGGRDLVIEANRVFNCQWGIEIGCENIGKTTSNVVVRSNIIYNNDDAGITIGGFDYPTGSGKVTNCQILNNTTYNNDKTTDGVGGPTAELTVSYTENCTIQNNIFYGGISATPLVYEDKLNSVNLNLDYNLYFGNLAATFEYQGVTYTNLIKYQNGTSQDLNSIFQDPLFRTLNIDDFHISMNSPAKNNGNPFSSSNNANSDYDDDIRIMDSRIDIGADEFKICSSILRLNGDLFSNSYSALQEIQSDGFVSKGSIISLSAPEVILKRETSVSSEGKLIIISESCQ